MNNNFIIVYACVDDKKLNYVRQLLLSILSFFYIANLTNDFIINRLDNKYNYMVNATISSLIPCKDLRIVHYWYESNKWKPINLFNQSDVSKEDIILITQRFKRSS